MTGVIEALPRPRSDRRAEPSARTGLRRFGQVSACAAVLFGFGEGVTRAALTSPSRQVFDAELGFRYLPDTVFFDGSEGGARLRLNSMGLNDAEPAPKGARPRVAVVGDSMTMAYQVERPANFVSRLGRLRPDLEFSNLAQADMGPIEYRILLRRFGAALDPDVVLFVFSSGDVDDVRRSRPVIERGPGGEIVGLVQVRVERHEMKRRVEPLLQRSALATLLMRRFGPTLARWSGGPAPDARPAEMGEDEVAEVIAFVLRDAAARRPVVAVFLPQREYGAGRWSRMDAPSARDAGVMARAAAEAGVPFHVAEAALARDYEASGQPGHGFHNRRVGTGHLNPAGHEAVARELAGFLAAGFARAAER